MNVLQEILTSKRAEIAARKRGGRLTIPEGRPASFVDALRAAPIGLIAEVKRRSPSAGAIREPFDPAAIARDYESAGAQALSVLMDEKYFGGGEEPFRAVRSAVRLPLLYKEFVVDEWQIEHAAAIGASAALLIVAALSPDELQFFIERCNELGLAALVEVHDEDETHRAVAAGASCIGVNNRDLRTFKVSLDTSFRLRKLVPDSILFVAESGIKTAQDVQSLKDAGSQAVLVGESLLRQADIKTAVRDLMERAWASS